MSCVTACYGLPRFLMRFKNVYNLQWQVFTFSILLYDYPKTCILSYLKIFICLITRYYQREAEGYCSETCVGLHADGQSINLLFINILFTVLKTFYYCECACTDQCNIAHWRSQDSIGNSVLCPLSRRIFLVVSTMPWNPA